MRLPLPLFGFLRLIFENFLMSPKGPPFIFLLFCNRTNVKKFKRVSQIFRHYETVKNSHFFENFSKSPNGPPSIFLNYRKRMDAVFFKDRCFSYATFSIFFHRSPPSIFTKNETFCDSKGLVKVFGTMRLQKNCRCPSKKFFENILEKFRKIFEKNFSFNFLFF